MRVHHRVIALSLLVLGISLGHDAWAQDIFVKPSQPTQHPVDLGLGIRPTVQPQPQQQQHVAQPPTQPTQQPTQPTTIQQPRVQPQPVPQPTPRPIVQPTPQPIPQPTPTPVIQAGKAEIIPVPDQPITISPGSGPNLFSIAIQPGTIGQAEVNDISKSLGLNNQEIATNCVFENMVVLAIGDGGSAITIGQLTNAQQHFSGNISSIDVFPTIACKKIKRPISGIIIEQGAYYKISAQNVSCPPPRAGSVTMSFKYLGNGKADCQYK